MLFTINEKGVLLHPEAVKLEPVLKKLSAPDLLFLILVYDYDSPYKQLPELQKKLTSSRRCYDNDDFVGHIKRLGKAIDAYNGLQYDIRRETIKNYQAKIAGLNIQLMATDSTLDIKKFHEAIDFLTKTSLRLQKDLVLEEVSALDGIGEDASFLEKWADNKRRFKSDQKSIDLIRNRKDLAHEPEK
jgi:hypothetical protein